MRNSFFAIGMLASVLIALPVFAQADKPKSAEAKPQTPKTATKPPLGPNPAWNPYAVFRQFKFIAALDPNSDGEISSKELDSALESLKKLDANSDGKLDPEEFIKAAPIPPTVKNFGALKALDLDKDDALSAEELAGAVEALKKLDANKDGKLDSVEYAMKSPMSMGGGGGGGAGGGGRQQASPEEFVKQNDKNGDGKVQKTELTGMIVGFFDRMDTDKDGSVTVEEVKASRERQRQQSSGGAAGGAGRGGPAPGSPAPGGPGAAPPAEKKAEAPKEETPKADAPK